MRVCLDTKELPSLASNKLDPYQTNCLLPSRTVVRVLPDLSDRYVISPDPGQFFLKLRLPEDVYCDQCILQVRPFDKGMWQPLPCLQELIFGACYVHELTGHGKAMVGALLRGVFRQIGARQP